MALCDTLTSMFISLTYVFLISCLAVPSIPLQFWIRGAVTFLKEDLFTSSQASCKSLFSPRDIINICLVHQRKMHTNLIPSTHTGLVRYDNNIFQAVSVRPWQSLTQNFCDAKPNIEELDTQGLHCTMWYLSIKCALKWEITSEFPLLHNNHKDLKV